MARYINQTIQEKDDPGGRADNDTHSDTIALTSTMSLKPSTASPSPPDGGLLAWSQVLAGHLVAFNSWGYVNSFGLFQVYYTTSLKQSPSAISWVGGIQIFLMMFIGTFSGRALDAGYYRYTAIAGLGLQVLGVFMTSLITEYWQLLLAQGICQGIGSGLVFTPTMAVVSTYFTKRRAVAVCGMSSGTATGGVVFPLIARQLLDRVGIGWTVRIMGFVFMFNAAVVLALVRPRNTPRKEGPLVEFKSFLDPWFSLFSLGMFLVVLGLYFAYYYLASFAQDVIHASSSTSLDLLLVINALGLPGRMIPAWIADRFLGPQNTLIIIVILTGTLTFLWAVIDTLPALWGFTVAYGLIAANIQSMVSPALASAERDPSKIGVEIGMIFSINGIGCLCGPPIAGALIERNGGDYLYAQMFAGSAIMSGALVFIAARVLCVGWSLKKKN
ncbi:hypothetical protein MMC17_003191 [Xylographa soralifera]|nr:hypothetical protein [Xylographa soralifera]